MVDDSLLAEYALKSYFVKLGHTVVGLAKTGEIGKQIFLETRPDLVTVDAVLPGISGQEFVKFINQNDLGNNNKTKILMISSDTIDDEQRRAMRVDKYIVKPITKARMEEILSELL
ncbi:MAG: response regulator [Candidatus Kariarchaeaceae archaeon]